MDEKTYQEFRAEYAILLAGVRDCEQKAKEATWAFEEALARAEAAERRIAELEAAQEWRPVTEDMEPEPEDHESVLVVCAVPDNQYYVTEAEYTCDGRWWWLDGVIWKEHKNVTHWRPLPQPPTPSNSTGLTDSA